MVVTPDAILLPGSLGAASVQQLSAKLAVREASLGSLTARRGSSPWPIRPSLVQHGKLSRLERAAHGRRLERGGLARRYRGRDGPRPPWWRPRPLSAGAGTHLLAATSARVAAIDTAFPDIRDLEGLRAEALAARRDGFTGRWRSIRPRSESSTTSSRREPSPLRKESVVTPGGCVGPRRLPLTESRPCAP